MEVKVIDNSEIFKKAKDQLVLAALESIGLTAERHAKEKCPVDTGLLRNSITHAVSGGHPAISAYQASYGSNINPKTGKRYSAKSKKAGEVKRGTYSGIAPNDPPSKPAAYIGTNVEYSKKQETGDSYHHTTGQAHFLRDSVSGHMDEYKRIIEKQLSKG